MYCAWANDIPNGRCLHVPLKMLHFGIHRAFSFLSWPFIMNLRLKGKEDTQQVCGSKAITKMRGGIRNLCLSCGILLIFQFTPFCMTLSLSCSCCFSDCSC